jgi:thiamine-phosphate pyrophosphorylase
VLAFVDQRIAALDDFGVRIAAVAAVGPAIGIVLQANALEAETLTRMAHRMVANCTPPGAATFVAGRVDIALAVGATGVIHRAGDLSIGDMRLAIMHANRPRKLAVLALVHSEPEAAQAATHGADGLIVGTIWSSASHPGKPAAGLDLVQRCAMYDLPVFAIGGVTADRAVEARRHHAWGVAAIRALWDGPDCHAAAREMLAATTDAELKTSALSAQ